MFKSKFQRWSFYAVLALAALSFGCNESSLVTPENGASITSGSSSSSTSTTGGGSTTTTTTPSSCKGLYVGSYTYPDHDERIRLRNLSLTKRGIAIVADETINNTNAGGGDPDGGIWMAGSYQFETDSNCNVVSGSTKVFYTYDYSISGVVNKDGSFSLTWAGQGSVGKMVGQVSSTNSISGKFYHPAPDDFVYGVLSGSFTPKN